MELTFILMCNLKHEAESQEDSLASPATLSSKENLWLGPAQSQSASLPEGQVSLLPMNTQTAKLGLKSEQDAKFKV